MNFKPVSSDRMSGAVQTASVGNQETLTYINVPNPTSVKIEPQFVSANGGNDFEDFRFSADFSTIFDDSPPNERFDGDQLKKPNANNVISVDRNSPLAVGKGTMDTSRLNTMASQRQQLGYLGSQQGACNQSFQPATITSGETSSLATSSVGAAQVPQHLMYQTQTQPLPQNVLHKQLGQQQIVSMNGGVQQNIVQYQQWLLPPAQQAENPATNMLTPALSQQPAVSYNNYVVQHGTNGITKEASQLVQKQPSQQVQQQPSQQVQQQPSQQVQQQPSQQVQQKPSQHLQQQQFTHPNVMTTKSEPPGMSDSIRQQESQLKNIKEQELKRSRQLKSSPDALSKRLKLSSFTPECAMSKDATETVASSVSGGEGGGVLKRRKDRNMREQERSQRIAHQIAQLKELLASSNVQFKPDKYSTLVTVAEYIKSLQQRSVMLDTEHRKLVDTVSRTNSVVNSSKLGPQSSPISSSSPNQENQGRQGPNIIPSDTDVVDDDLVFVGGLDYKSVFSNCGVAMAITTIDGRLLECNIEFAHFCGITDKKLKSAGLCSNKFEPHSSSNEANCIMQNEVKQPLSLFNVLQQEDMQGVFSAMSRMLKNSESLDATSHLKGVNSGDSVNSDQWTSTVKRSNKIGIELQVNISLVRSNDGNPKYFNCALTKAVESN